MTKKIAWFYKNSKIYLKKFIKREIDYYKVVPNDVLIFLTYRCTGRCSTCNMWRRPVNIKEELTLDEYKRFIDEICDYGGDYRNVEMFGGDALLRKDVLIPLIRYVKEKGIPRCSLPTNGNLLDEETAFGLVDAELDIVEISIDSISDVHNKMRGVDNTFERAERAIKFLLKARGNQLTPKIQVNCTISRMNVDSFERLLQFSEDIGADIIAFEYVGEFPEDAIKKSGIDGKTPSPYFVSKDGSNLLNGTQAEILKNKIKKIKRDSKRMRVHCITTNIDVLKVKNLVSGYFPHKKCYMSHSLITLDPFGNILGCPFFDNYIIGNIREDKFPNIWNNHRHKLFMDAVNNSRKRPEICNYCILSVERNPSFFTSIRRLLYINRKTKKL